MIDDKYWRDELTPFERKVYRRITYVALAVVLLCLVVLRSKSGEDSFIFLCVGFVALFVGIVFGWGYNKSVRVLDLRKREKK